MELRRLEEREELLQDEQNIRGFYRNINHTFDKNLEELLHKSLIDVVEENDLKESDMPILWKFINKVKDNLE